jgi:hypothetical protein
MRGRLVLKGEIELCGVVAVGEPKQSIHELEKTFKSGRINRGSGVAAGSSSGAKDASRTQQLGTWAQTERTLVCPHHTPIYRGQGRASVC